MTRLSHETNRIITASNVSSAVSVFQYRSGMWL